MAARMPRMEVRQPANAAIRITSLDPPEASETLAIHDVSRHGARALAASPWKQGDRVLVQALKGTFCAHGRIVYCNPLEGAEARYVIGLEFFFPTGKLED